jgi:hypothetical protein
MNTPLPDPPFSWALWVKDTFERATSTLVQVLVPLVLVILQNGQERVDWKALGAAGFAAVGSVLLAAIPQLVPKNLTYWPDVALRLGKTIIVTALSLLVATGANIYDGTLWQSVWVAVGTAVLVFVKAEIARRLGDSARSRVSSMPQITPASLAQLPKAS